MERIFELIGCFNDNQFSHKVKKHLSFFNFIIIIFFKNYPVANNDLLTRSFNDVVKKISKR